MSRHLTIRLAVTAMLALGATLAVAQPPNDNCANAYTLYPPHVISGNTAGATVESAYGACGNIASDVWFRFVAPFTGTAAASTCPLLGPGSTNYDTVIAIRQHYQCGLSVVVGCNDDAFNCAYASHCVAPIQIGLVYDIQLGGYLGATGLYTLSLTVSPAVPSNDACVNAIPMTVSSYVNAETFAATTGPDPTPSCWSTVNDVWYSFVAPTSGAYTANTCYAPNLTTDTVIGVWQGSCGALTQIACDNNGCGGSPGGSSATWCATAGTNYYISVGSTAGAGTFSMIITPNSNPPMRLAFFNSGPGSLGFTVNDGPLGGFEFTTFTFTHGAYPNAWFFGIDASLDDVVGQWSSGYPYSASLSALCGNVVLGPFFNLPSGVTVYAVSLGFAPSSMNHPSKISNPATATIP